METTTMHVTGHPGIRHPLSRRSRISIGVLAMLASLHAHGQETAAAAATAAADAAPAATTSADGKSADSVVVVTGFRASLNSALNTKKNSATASST
jgi:iron complex outermembrane receptor protein